MSKRDRHIIIPNQDGQDLPIGFIGWRLPITFLAGLAVLAAAFYDGGSSASLGSPLMHWTMGSTMVAAFFVLTDPVTHPNQPRAQILFALIVAVTTRSVRERVGAR